ncbi:MAG: TraR/DksA C4-type zinc finger protein [Bacteriovoracaceae bacterium]|nr:TraR/DksA C4-type zinc finger protein [Bacteriovoracaceae bacterium]
MLRENHHLSDKQIAAIKDKLTVDRKRFSAKERSSDRFCLDKNELSDVLDEASINIQASHELRFRNREIFYLKKVNKSLEQIELGSYGFCQDCANEISFERLIARPTANLCISCKEEAEFSENNNFYQRKSKSLGKTMSEIGKH